MRSVWKVLCVRWGCIHLPSDCQPRSAAAETGCRGRAELRPCTAASLSRPVSVHPWNLQPSRWPWRLPGLRSWPPYLEQQSKLMSRTQIKHFICNRSRFFFGIFWGVRRGDSPLTPLVRALRLLRPIEVPVRLCSVPREARVFMAAPALDPAVEPAGRFFKKCIQR